MNADEQDTVQAREDHVQEVSLRAVELLAKAQRAADEAVAEAQSYARDLEQSAREQYQQILQRAQAAAQQVASAEGPASGPGRGVAREEAGALDTQKLTYVRTYARVAHAQLKSVLAVLNDELDQLAAMAEGNAAAAQGPGHPSGAAGPAEPAAPAARPGPTGLPSVVDVPHWPGDNAATGPGGVNARGGARSTDEGSWPPIFAATNAISYVYRGSSPDGPRLE